MIIRITGKLVQLDGQVAVLERDGIGYALYLPGYLADALGGRLGEDVTFHTIQYYEGTVGGGNMYPRLIAFLDASDRAFFLEFTKVKGIGMRKALRAMARPASWIAEVIERGDTKLLATLPELGKRTAEQLVASLKGKLETFAAPQAVDTGGELAQGQREALDVLVQLGERRGEALELIRKVTADQGLSDTAKIIEAVYKLKSGTI